jgi:hypothetical protein
MVDRAWRLILRSPGSYIRITYRPRSTPFDVTLAVYLSHIMSLIHGGVSERPGFNLLIVPGIALIRKGFPELCLKNNHSQGAMGVPMHLVGGQARRSWIHRRLSGGIKTYA